MKVWKEIKTLNASPKKGKSYKPKYGFKTMKKLYKKVSWM